MFATLKTNANLAWDGLFGPRYGFFDLMAAAGKFPVDTTHVVALHDAANLNRPSNLADRRPAAPVSPSARPAAGIGEAA